MAAGFAGARETSGGLASMRPGKSVTGDIEAGYRTGPHARFALAQFATMTEDEPMSSTLPRITPHQKWALARLCRLSSSAYMLSGDEEFPYVLGKDVGAPAALDHLVRKGYATRRFEYGPRGGEHRLYRPTEIGWRSGRA